MIPTIETPRLLLRGHRLSDFPDCAGMWADPAVTQYIGGQPVSTEDAWTKFLRYAGHWALLGFGFWAVEERATGAYVGELGFADFKRDMQPPLGTAHEAGWVLASSVHGKGYATEALRAALHWSDEIHNGARTVCLINPANAASIRVAEKCGFEEDTRATYKGHQVLVFARPRSLR